MSTRSLTHLQVQVLGSIAAGRDGVTPTQVADDIRVSVSSARTAAMALERRGLVEATYSGMRGCRGYVTTDAGQTELLSLIHI